MVRADSPKVHDALNGERRSFCDCDEIGSEKVVFEV